jgi:hypothetical protein
LDVLEFAATRSEAKLVDPSRKEVKAGAYRGDIDGLRTVAVLSVVVPAR